MVVAGLRDWLRGTLGFDPLAPVGLLDTLGVTPPLGPAVRPTFYDRPFRISDAGRFVRALRNQIGDETVRSMPLIGAVDQFVDSTDAIGNHALRRAAVAARLGPTLSGTDRRPAEG